MIRIVLIVPDWVGQLGQPSALRQSIEGTPGLHELRERGTLTYLDRESTGLLEAAYVGLDPSTVNMPPGPLTVAALGADPPSRSVHFHLSLMNLDDNGRIQAASQTTEPECRELVGAAERLNSKTLTLVPGSGLDHALVWESGSVDLRTYSASKASGKPYQSVLPEGDGETLLRRYIDDSVNLLANLDLNQRRRDEGQPTLNLLWPWGQGFRATLPNLAMARGEVVRVESGSLQLAGLSRLVGYRHGERAAFGFPLRPPLARLAAEIESHQAWIIVLESFTELRSRGMHDEAAWLTREIDRGLVQPLAELMRSQLVRVSIVCPSTVPETGALAMTSQSKHGADSSTPFDERALEAPTRGVTTIANVIRQALEP